MTVPQQSRVCTATQPRRHGMLERKTNRACIPDRGHGNDSDIHIKTLQVYAISAATSTTVSQFTCQYSLLAFIAY